MNEYQTTNELCIIYIITLSEYEDGSLHQNVNYYLNNINSKYKFDLLFYFDEFPQENSYKFMRKLSKFEKFKNINKVHVINNNIIEEDNFYDDSTKGKIDLERFPLGYAHGINLHFYTSIYDLFNREYEHFMMLETDTKPLHDNWYDVLLNYCKHNDFVIAGSKYKGETRHKVFKEFYGGHHINGVALYKNNETTKKVITSSEQFLINCLIKDSQKARRHKKCNGTMNYDVAIYLYAKNKKILHLLKDTDIIANVSLEIDKDLSLNDIIKEYPNIAVIHKKNLFMKSNEFNIKVLKENKVYRLADLFYMDGNRWEHDRNIILENSEYKDTILYDYLTQKTSEKDFNLFKQIALKHSSKYENKPSNDDLVFHLRLGDAFNKKGDDKIDNRVDWSYLQYRVFFRKNREYLKSLNEVKVVTAMNFSADDLSGNFYYTDDCYNESLKFVDYFCERLSSFNCAVKIISNENIDEDICYLMQAKHFVPGLSKFSTLIAKSLGTDAKLYRDPIKKYI